MTTATLLSLAAALTSAALPEPAELNLTAGDTGRSMSVKLRTAEDVNRWAAACGGLTVNRHPHKRGGDRALLAARGPWDGVDVLLTADVAVQAPEMAATR